MADWDKTIYMQKRIGIDDLENEKFGGRFIIHRDSLIDGGVYLSEGRAEAIVVDSQKQPMIKRLYEKAKKRASKDGVIKKERILTAVYDVVSETLPKLDADAVKELIRKYGIGNDEKISLDCFLDAGVGICKHAALACGVLLELFEKDGHIKGKARINRNSDGTSGHAWCRYTSFSGNVFILDIALKYAGSLEDSIDKDIWDYRSSEDF